MLSPLHGRHRLPRTRLIAPAAILVAVLALGLGWTASPAAAEEYNEGDLFVAVGGGIIRHFDSQGEEIEDLDTETASPEIGDMCFGPGVMYSMNFQDGSISKFDGAGNLVESQWATGLAGSPESCVLDEGGNLYVGQSDGLAGNLQKLNSDAEIVETFAPDAENSGVDQIDLAADQCTMLYTSEGGSIKAYDVCDNEQLPDFATGLGTNCNNLRIRPNREVLVACDNSVLRLSPEGDVVQTYDPPDVDADSGGLFALNLDNDGEHFYTATYQAGLVWRIDIASGDGTDDPYIQTVIEGDSIGGLAIFGEITVAFTAPLTLTDRPEIVRAFPDPTQISTDPEVVGTSAVLAVIAAIVILLSSQIFNETIEDNNTEIERFTRRYVRPLSSPFAAARNVWRGFFTGNPQAGRIASIGVVLIATALVYGFLEPGFKLDKDGILLIAAVVVALGALTYAYSGVESRITERRYQIPSGVRVYPIAIALAVVSVLVSRVVSFQPGVIYGFVASNVVLAGAAGPDRRQKGFAVLTAAVALMAVFAASWAAMIPLREWADSDDNFAAVLLESSATLIAVGAVETLAFTMVPIEFTHGIKVWRLNRVAWFAIAIVTAFAFWHVLLVQDEAGFKSVENGNTIGALAALGVCVGITAATWFFFYSRKRRATRLEAAAASPEQTATAEPDLPKEQTIESTSEPTTEAPEELESE